METENLDQIKQRMDDIKPVIAKLQWDKEHNQLNPGKLPYLQSLEKEYETLIKQVNGENTPDSEVLEENATL